MKRKIAIIADGWRRHITYVWIRGCRNYIKEHELDIEISVFHSFGNFSRDEKFNTGEYNIIHLPDLSQFDGIILEVTNMLNQKKKQQIIRIIQESGVPADSQENLLRWQAYEKHLLPDAFVCANENIAVGLCHQAQQEGFKIPADFCVTGFDNFDKASYYRPRITTVSGGEIIERFHG